MLLVLCVIEGIFSLSRVALLAGLNARRSLAERHHTRYDPQLGWVNEPHVALPDFYGPGASLHTNARGFRDERPFSPAVPPGRLRVVCSGDSFALGYGVGDDDTWCRRLEAIDPRLVTVNMGQGGYGLGQAYLWYRRDGASVEHDVHLFTFIYDDFARLSARRFAGYGKPVLRVSEDGDLMAENTPVPRGAFRFPWLRRNVWLLDELRSVRILRKLVFGGHRGAASFDDDPERIARVTGAVFESLQQMHDEEGRLGVLVYLPMLDEYESDHTARSRQFLREEAERVGLPFLDLVEALRSVPRDELPELFIPEGALDFRAGAGHYTVEGNRVVGRWIYDGLSRLPGFRRRLDAVCGEPEAPPCPTDEWLSSST